MTVPLPSPAGMSPTGLDRKVSSRSPWVMCTNCSAVLSIVFSLPVHPGWSEVLRGQRPGAQPGAHDAGADQKGSHGGVLGELVPPCPHDSGERIGHVACDAQEPPAPPGLTSGR